MISPERPDSFPGAASGEISLSLTEVAIALSDALNLVGIEDAGHGKRVAFMATEIGRAAGFSPDALQLLFLSALLHDCGVSSSRVFRKLTDNFDWEESAEHCLAGHRLLSGFPPLRTAASIVLHHHDRWDSAARRETEGRIALLANAIFLADRTDVLRLSLQPSDILVSRRAVRDGIAERSKSYFAPELVGAFLEVSLSEAFWLTLEEPHIDRYVEDELHASRPGTTDLRSLRELAGIFAQIVDAKSPFTAEHSKGVARLARLLGSLQGMPDDVCDQLEIAGLLHDVGKLRVTEEIIDKPAALTREERALVTRHSYDTGHILRKVFPGQPIARWAAMHHENLLGTGYPRHLGAAGIPREARLIAVADIFQACCQERPYRKQLAAREAMAELDAMLAAGRIDAEMVELVRSHLAACYALAVGAE